MEIGGPELLIVLVVVVVLFGPGRVTGLARSLGEAIHEFRAGAATPPDTAGPDAAGGAGRGAARTSSAGEADD